MEDYEFDFVKPDFSFLGPRKRVLFFTVGAIQMVREIPLKLIELMAGAADYVKTVHFEPFGFQLEPNLGEATANHARWIMEKGWNINLGPILVEAHNSGIIRCTHLLAEILGGGGDPQSLAIWEAGAPSASA